MADPTLRPSSDDAGRGADEQARRAATRVERLRTQLESAERQQRAWAAGGEGERLVARAITHACWPALHDQPWPGRQRANIDHLALSSSRIWVVDAKHWSGEVLIRGGVLRQNGYRRDRFIGQAATSASDVAVALGKGAPPVRAMICLTQAGRQLPPTVVDGVTVVGLDHLAVALGPAPQDYETMPKLVNAVRESLVRPDRATRWPVTKSPIAPVHTPVPTVRNASPGPWSEFEGALSPGVQVRYRYASWTERAKATLIDWTLLLPLLIVASPPPAGKPELLDVVAGWAWLLFATWFAWLNGKKGQSPGKALLGLKVVRVRDGTALGGRRGLLRALVLALMGILTAGMLFLVALAWPIWDRRNQALHDKFVGASVAAGHPRARLRPGIFGL